MKNLSYFELRKESCLKKLEQLLTELPYYCEEYFVGIENRTTPLTRLNYAYDLRIFFEYLSKKCFRDKKTYEISLKDLDSLHSEDIEFFVSYLSRYTINGKNETCSENGKARKLASIRSFYKYFFNKNKLSSNIASKVQMPKIHEKEIIRLETNKKTNEIADMLYVVNSGSGLTAKQKAFHKETHIRDAAIITLFLGTGIRISELVGLNLEDVDFNSNAFVVTRKGGNRAVLYFNEQVRQTLLDYISHRNNNENISKNESALFVSLQNTRISTRTVQELVKKYAKIVTPLKKITPHKLRSTFGTNLYRQTGDIYIVADCLGHSDVNTTKKHYAAVSDDLRKKAGSNINITNEKDEQET